MELLRFVHPKQDYWIVFDKSLVITSNVPLIVSTFRHISFSRMDYLSKCSNCQGTIHELSGLFLEIKKNNLIFLNIFVLDFRYLFSTKQEMYVVVP